MPSRVLEPVQGVLGTEECPWTGCWCSGVCNKSTGNTFLALWQGFHVDEQCAIGFLGSRLHVHSWSREG